VGPDRQRDRLTQRARRLDRIATYGLPAERREGELADRAATFEELAELVPERRLLNWKRRSTALELTHRVVVDSRSEPSTLPAAIRLVFVSISTGVISAMAIDPASELVARDGGLRSDLFVGAQLAAGVLALWVVVTLLRHPDHLPVRPLALPHSLLLVAMGTQAVTNSPVVTTDHLYTVSCVLYCVGLSVLTLAGWGLIPLGPVRWGYRLNAVASVFTGLNVFDLVNDTYGAVSVAGAVQVVAICLGVTSAMMLSRLPFHDDTAPPPATAPATAPETPNPAP